MKPSKNRPTLEVKDAYADNWERIFGGKPRDPDAPFVRRVRGHGDLGRLAYAALPRKGVKPDPGL